jgi:hypothetical protein
LRGKSFQIRKFLEAFLMKLFYNIHGKTKIKTLLMEKSSFNNNPLFNFKKFSTKREKLQKTNNFYCKNVKNIFLILKFKIKILLFV